MPCKEQMNTDYSALNRRFEAQAAWTGYFQKKLLQTLKTTPPWRMLETGCGTGALIRSMAGIASGDFLFYGIDKDLGGLKFAQTRQLSNLSGGAGEALPFPPDTFDLVCCHYLLLWVPDPVKILLEMRRCCKPRGIVAVIAEPDYTARADYPPTAASAGVRQTDALQKQGIDPQTGRRVFGWMLQAGFSRPVFGVHGVERTFHEQCDFLMAENRQCGQDIISGLTSVPASMDQSAASAVIYVPTFFSYAVKEA